MQKIKKVRKAITLNTDLPALEVSVEARLGHLPAGVPRESEALCLSELLSPFGNGVMITSALLARWWDGGDRAGESALSGGGGYSAEVSRTK